MSEDEYERHKEGMMDKAIENLDMVAMGSGLEEQLFDSNTQIVEKDQEIVVHWVNKYGVPMDIKTRKGGLIHALWIAEHKKRSRKRISDDKDVIDIQPEITECPPKQLSNDNNNP